MKSLLALLILTINFASFQSHAVRIGDENRVEVTKEEYPTSAVGQLASRYIKADFDGKCTGTLIGPSLVITAAHCVYDVDQGGWADRLVFAPDARRQRETEQDFFQAEKVYYMTPYLQYSGSNGFLVMAGVPYDIAVVRLKKNRGQPPAGEIYGWLAIGDGVPVGRVTMISYPADKPALSKWIETRCPLYGFKDGVYNFECDAFQGASGSALTVDNGKELVINGIFSADNIKLQMNFAAKIEPAIYDALLAIINAQPQSLFQEHVMK